MIMMKRGSSVRNYIDSYKKRDNELTVEMCNNDRRPSKIEERIRARRTNLGLKKMIENSCESYFSCNGKSSSSCCSSSSECEGKMFSKGSKERVELLEVSPIILGTKTKNKNRVKSGTLKTFFGATRRPKSAPCSPLFRIKLTKKKDNNQSASNGNDYVDCKIVERDCIVAVERSRENREEVETDKEPIGNPALISLMKESLDKLGAAAEMKSNDEEMREPEVAGDSEVVTKVRVESEAEFFSGDDPGARNELEKDAEERPGTAAPVKIQICDLKTVDNFDFLSNRCCGFRNPIACRKSRDSDSRESSRRCSESCGWSDSTPGHRFAVKNGTFDSARKSPQPMISRPCNRCRESTGSTELGICRVKIQERRSSSSPRRRVTFRFPSLVIPEEEEEEEAGKKNPSNSFSARDNASGSVNEDKESIVKFEDVALTPIISSCRGGNYRSNFRRRCGYCYSYCNNRRQRSRSPKPANICKKILARNNYRNDDAAIKDPTDHSDSNKDWDVDCDENIYSAVENNVSFPKETRLAMNVLMQSTERKAKEEHRPVQGIRKKLLVLQQQPLREANVLKKPDLEIFNIEGDDKAMRMCDPLARSSYNKKKRRFPRKESDGEIIVNPRQYREINCRSNFGPFKDIENLTTDNSESDQRTFSGSGRHEIIDMQTNGSDNGSSENGVDRTGWTVGLINGRFKYLTAETFGFKINANGASLKKKQLWTLEGSEHQVFLRSHLDRYLAVDQFGNVTCEAEDTADPGCAFQIQVASDGSGRWALKNIQRGYFLGSSQDELKCTAKVPGDAEYWLVHLAARPQVNLRSAGRKRFAHLSAAQDEIHVDAPVPWGEDTLFTLEFRPAAMPDAIEGNGDVRRDVRSEAGIGGHYALHTCNNKYLARDGKLLDSCTRDCLYAAEFHAGMLALRDVSGAYLAPIGSKAVLKSRSNTVTRDELFSLEDSLPQASFVAALNQRYVSVKQGVDVTANQDEISGHETFQLEFDRATKRWYLRTMQDRYWTLEAGGGIQASDHKRSSNALFDLIWQPADGTVALRANNGKFLATKRSGHLYANADTPGESEASKFYFYLMNRPVLVLRCEQGFVGLKSNASPKLECNKASYETIRVERCDRGIVRFKGQNGKYWHADSEGVTSDADVPSDGFYLELREPSRICIKSTDGRYLSAGKNGVFRLGETDYESATKWEF